MLKSMFAVALLWVLVMLAIQSIRKMSGKDLLSWTKLALNGLVGAVITGILVSGLVTLF